MAVEQYINTTKTTLNAAYTAADGVLNVATTGAPFPQVPNFRIAVMNTTETLVKVVLKVTAINSATQWAVIAEGDDANALNGDHVVGTWWTAGALDAIRSDMVGIGTYANLPAANTKKAGDQYICSDSLYRFTHNGSVWVPFFLNYPNITLPPSIGSLTWVNQGGATADSTYGGIIMKAPAAGSNDVKALVKTAFGASFTFIIALTAQGQSDAYGIHGIALRDSTSGKIVIFGTFNNGLGVTYFNTATSFGSFKWNITSIFTKSPLFLKVVYDSVGATLTYHWSIDGINWDQALQTTKTDHLAAPDQAGICMDVQNNFLATAWFFHWTGL